LVDWFILNLPVHIYEVVAERKILSRSLSTQVFLSGRRKKGEKGGEEDFEPLLGGEGKREKKRGEGGEISQHFGCVSIVI